MVKYKEEEKEHQEETIRDENRKIRGVEIRKVAGKIRGVLIGKRGSSFFIFLQIRYKILKMVNNCNDYSPFLEFFLIFGEK